MMRVDLNVLCQIRVTEDFSSLHAFGFYRRLALDCAKNKALERISSSKQLLLMAFVYVKNL